MAIVSKKTPLVSVLIPVFNGVQFLDEVVESVFTSTSLPVEMILVDDGSVDGSKEKCRRLEQRYPMVHYYDFRRNKGMTRCLNFGIAQARGTYIARINQDDLMMPGRLEKQVAFLEAHPDHVAVGSYIELFTRDNPHYDTIMFPTQDDQLKRDWMTLSPFSDPTVMYRKAVFLQTQGYSQEMWPADDVHMWYQLGQLGKLANIPEILTRVRWHKGAGSIRSHRLQMKKTLQVHRWAAERIRTPSVGERAFWMGQHVAGQLLPPELNWKVYRLIRKIWKKRQISLSLWQVWERAAWIFSWPK